MIGPFARALPLLAVALPGCHYQRAVDGASVHTSMTTLPGLGAGSSASTHRAEFEPRSEPAPAVHPSARVLRETEHGRLETIDDGKGHELKVLRVWGTPTERGVAHGTLLAEEIVTLVRTEWTTRFSWKPALLDEGRRMAGRLIDWPEPMRTEIEAVYTGLVATKVSLKLEKFSRDMDLQDLLFANALDVFATLACSGFTAWGDRVEGGGVLSARNFDWPFTGSFLIENVVLLVQHPTGADTQPTASITWPGYVGAVTAINAAGEAVYLHVGSGKHTMAPEPESWPTAAAARHILERSHASLFDRAREALEYTSPPAGYLVRTIAGKVAEDDVPTRVFEVDSRSVSESKPEAKGGLRITTNHYLDRKDGRQAAFDSRKRFESVAKCVADYLAADDQMVNAEEAWAALDSVQRSGKRFGTLHSLVFRAEPWVFELGVGTIREDGGVATATRGPRFKLERNAVFGGVPEQKK